jgi:hypothetical protein
MSSIFDRFIELVSNLTELEAFKIVEVEGGALFVVQLGKRREQLSPSQACRQLLFDARVLHQSILNVGQICTTVEASSFEVGATASGMPVGHLDDPSPGCALGRIKGMRFFEQSEKYVLHQVLSFAGIAKDAKTDRKNKARIPTEQKGQGLQLTCSQTGKQDLIRDMFEIEGHFLSRGWAQVPLRNWEPEQRLGRIRTHVSSILASTGIAYRSAQPGAQEGDGGEYIYLWTGRRSLFGMRRAKNNIEIAWYTMDFGSITYFPGFFPFLLEYGRVQQFTILAYALERSRHLTALRGPKLYAARTEGRDVTKVTAPCVTKRHIDHLEYPESDFLLFFAVPDRIKLREGSMQRQ